MRPSFRRRTIISPRVVAALDRLAHEYAAIAGRGAEVEHRIATIVDEFETVLREQVDHKLVREAWRDYFLGIAARPVLLAGELKDAARARRQADRLLGD